MRDLQDDGRRQKSPHSGELQSGSLPTSPPEVGESRVGQVLRVQPNGAVISLGHGFEGFLSNHRIDLRDPTMTAVDLFRVGHEVRVKVLKVTGRESAFIRLAIDVGDADPWKDVHEHHAIGDRARGVVTGFLSNFGTMVRLSSGFAAMVHANDLLWTGKKALGCEVVSIGDEIDVVITKVDPQKRKLGASLRLTQPNPWDSFLDDFPLGSTQEGTVQTVKDFGLFVRLKNGLDGLVHQTNIPVNFPWPEKGEQIDVKILSFDREKQRIELGIEE